MAKHERPKLVTHESDDVTAPEEDSWEWAPALNLRRQSDNVR